MNTTGNIVLDTVAEALHEIASKLYCTGKDPERELADVFCTLGNHVSEASIKLAAETNADKILLELASTIAEVSKLQFAKDTRMIRFALQELAKEIRLSISSVEAVEAVKVPFDDMNPF